MSSIMTRWSVMEEHRVGVGDRDACGAIADAAVERWVRRACASYLDQCAGLQQRRRDEGWELTEDLSSVPTGDALGSAPEVFVSASATEVLPASFVIGVRVRTVESSDDRIFNVRCEVRLVDGDRTIDIDTSIRDELIALEHAARHYN
jgi:hypothetical protein